MAIWSETTDTLRSAESGHWYRRDGSPVYTIMGANGIVRDTTLRDARKPENLFCPSVSGLIKLMAAPGLEHYKQESLMMATLTLPRLPHEPEKSWMARVWQDSREHARKAAEYGTAVHAAVQGHYEGVPPAPEFLRHVQGAVETLDEYFPNARWIPEQSFAHPLGYGGKLDLNFVAHDGVVIDIKTKEWTDKLPGIYDEHSMQLAAYRRGIGQPRAACGNLFVNVKNPGESYLAMHKQADLERGLAMFDACLALWKAKNKYDPSFVREEQTA